MVERAHACLLGQLTLRPIRITVKALPLCAKYRHVHTAGPTLPRGQSAQSVVWMRLSLRPSLGFSSGSAECFYSAFESVRVQANPISLIRDAGRWLTTQHQTRTRLCQLQQRALYMSSVNKAIAAWYRSAFKLLVLPDAFHRGSYRGLRFQWRTRQPDRNRPNDPGAKQHYYRSQERKQGVTGT